MPLVKRRLPSTAEAADILSRKRTRPTRRPPPAAGRQLRKFLQTLDARFGQGPQALAARWPEIVGADIARRTEPVRLVKPRGGGPASLELRVAPGAATVVQHQGLDIIARANLFLGAGAVGKLRIVQGPVRSRVAAQARTPVSGRKRAGVPLDAAAEAELAQGVAAARDKGLQDALIRLGRGVKRAERAPSSVSRD
jgi:hypothetical protein